METVTIPQTHKILSWYWFWLLCMVIFICFDCLQQHNCQKEKAIRQNNSYRKGKVCKRIRILIVRENWRKTHFAFFVLVLCPILSLPISGYGEENVTISTVQGNFLLNVLHNTLSVFGGLLLVLPAPHYKSAVIACPSSDIR